MTRKILIIGAGSIGIIGTLLATLKGIDVEASTWERVESKTHVRRPVEDRLTTADNGSPALGMYCDLDEVIMCYYASPGEEREYEPPVDLASVGFKLYALRMPSNASITGAAATRTGKDSVWVAIRQLPAKGLIEITDGVQYRASRRQLAQLTSLRRDNLRNSG